MFDDFTAERNGFFFEFSLLIIVLGLYVIGRLFNLSIEPRRSESLFNFPSFHIGIDHNEIVLDHLELLELVKPLLPLLHVFVALEEIVLDPVLDRVKSQRDYDHHKKQLHPRVPFETFQWSLAKPSQHFRKVQLYNKKEKFDKKDDDAPDDKLEAPHAVIYIFISLRVVICEVKSALQRINLVFDRHSLNLEVQKIAKGDSKGRVHDHVHEVPGAAITPLDHFLENHCQQKIYTVC